ncbi:hypothetical protein HMPREF9370_1896 [Neisseria wadsworthii 9715]|uniref:Uncharacterized protein n=1 Tax=Neisseria wadsworthii 9715 TaxID=1030841 RepID=G4CS36_9NEIS|nr:hypothetical protein HMPREF9370_1896 [Neisseria wadsworthii 9715]
MIQSVAFLMNGKIDFDEKGKFLKQKIIKSLSENVSDRLFVVKI